MKPITAHKLTYWGIDHASHFPGAGVAFTNWTDSFVGIGNTPHDAGEDASDQAADCDYDTLVIANDLLKRIDSRLLHFEDCPRSRRWDAECNGCDELHCYAVLYVR